MLTDDFCMGLYVIAFKRNEEIKLKIILVKFVREPIEMVTFKCKRAEMR